MSKYLEKNSGKNKVERFGYVSLEDRYNEMRIQGAKLDAYRRGFEFNPEINDNFMVVDPTRGRNFDLADYSARMREVKARLDVARAEKAAAKAAADAAAKEQAPPPVEKLATEAQEA